MEDEIASNIAKKMSDGTYIPKNKALLFVCSNTDVCLTNNFASITELTASFMLKSCFTKSIKNHTYLCVIKKFKCLSHMNKRLILPKTIPEKPFYLFNCLVKANGTQVCHKKANDTHIKRVIYSNPRHVSVLDEFFCEHGKATSDKHNPPSIRDSNNNTMNPGAYANALKILFNAFIKAEKNQTLTDLLHCQIDPTHNYGHYSTEFINRSGNHENIYRKNDDASENKNSESDKAKVGDGTGETKSRLISSKEQNALVKIHGFVIKKPGETGIATKFRFNDTEKMSVHAKHDNCTTEGCPFVSRQTLDLHAIAIKEK